MQLTTYSTFTESTDHIELVQAMAAAYRVQLTDAELEAYLMALHDVPLQCCRQAAVELIRTHTSDFIPKFGPWREVAERIWHAEIRREQQENQQRQYIEYKSRKMRPGELEQALEDVISGKIQNSKWTPESAAAFLAGLRAKRKRAEAERARETNGPVDFQTSQAFKVQP